MIGTKVFLRLVLVVLLVILLAGSVSGAIIWDVNGHQYELVHISGIDWDSAANDVTTRLGSDWHLATITSQAENDFVFLNLVQNAGGSEFWLGGYQSPITEPIANKNWVWVTGEPWGYTNWASVEPSDSYGSASEQHLVMINWGEWNDEGNLIYISGYIAEKEIVTIAIDIKPGVYPNTINLGTSGTVPVAILTTADFDASTVAPTTVIFANASPIKRKMLDVDSDGDIDMVLYFNIRELNLGINSTEATLTGETNDGEQIVGTDSVSVVRKGKK